MSDEDNSAMLSSKTFLCLTCTKFGDIETLENTEEETTAVSNFEQNAFSIFFLVFYVHGPLDHLAK